jgi:hypothetical protein
MTMNFNQFQKTLRDRGIDGPMAVILTMMYEQILENAKQLDACASVLIKVTDTVQNVVGLHEHLKAGIDDTRARLGIKDDEVQSVPLTDEEDYQS